MKKGLYIFLLLALAFSAIAAEPDSFEQARTQDRIDQIPAETLELCKAEVDRGMVYIEKKVDARIEGLPVLIGGATMFGMILGVTLGTLISIVLFKNYRLRKLRLLSQVNKELKQTGDQIRKDLTDMRNQIAGLNAQLERNHKLEIKESGGRLFVIGKSLKKMLGRS